MSGGHEFIVSVANVRLSKSTSVAEQQRRAGRHRRPVDLQRRQRRSRRRRRSDRRLASGQRRVRLGLDCDHARAAADFLPHPRRGCRRDARRPRPSDGDVLRGSSGGNRVWPRAICGSPSTRCGAGSNSVWRWRSTSRRSPGGGAHDRIAAAPSLLDSLAPLAGAAAARRGRQRRDQGNLATRPFYNDRVAMWLFAAAVVVGAATVFNISQMVRYSRSDTELARQAATTRRAPQSLRARRPVSARPWTPTNRARLHRGPTCERMIDRRDLLGTALWNEFEATLPQNVRITSFRPRLEPKRGNVVTISVIARSVDDVQEFRKPGEDGPSGNLPAVRAHQRRGAARDGYRGGLHTTRAPPAPTPTPRRRSRGR